MPRASSPARLALLPLAALLWLAAPAAVLGHAELESTSPADGAVLGAPPEEVVARFTGGLEADSRIELLAPDGSSVASGGRDPDDPTRLVLDAPADLVPGRYTVRWRAVSEDGHLERDTFRFTIAAAAPTSTPTPGATPSGAASGTSSSGVPVPTVVTTPPPAPAPDPAADPGGAAVLAPILVALAVLGVLGFALLGRRGAG